MPILRKPGPQAAVPDSVARISVVIPVLDEAGNIAAVLDELDGALRGRVDFDVVVVDDGSSDGTGDVVALCARRMPGLALVRHDRRAGQSAGLRSGARIAGSDWLITMDGDGQYDPADIHALIAALESAPQPQPALVYGIRSSRRDTTARRFASRFANGLRDWMLREGCPDTGCGLKLINRERLLGPAVLRRAAPLSAGVGPGLRLWRAGRCGAPPPAARRCIEIHQCRARSGRPVRPVRRDVADPAYPPAGGAIGAVAP